LNFIKRLFSARVPRRTASDGSESIVPRVPQLDHCYVCGLRTPDTCYGYYIHGNAVPVWYCNECGKSPRIYKIPNNGGGVALESTPLLADWIRQAVKLDKFMHEYPVYQMPASVVSQVMEFVHEIAWTRIPANNSIRRGEQPSPECSGSTGGNHGND